MIQKKKTMHLTIEKRSIIQEPIVLMKYGCSILFFENMREYNEILYQATEVEPINFHICFIDVEKCD